MCCGWYLVHDWAPGAIHEQTSRRCRRCGLIQCIGEDWDAVTGDLARAFIPEDAVMDPEFDPPAPKRPPIDVQALATVLAHFGGVILFALRALYMLLGLWGVAAPLVAFFAYFHPGNEPFIAVTAVTAAPALLTCAGAVCLDDWLTRESSPGSPDV